MQRETFARLVRDALNHLYDPVHLQAHSLIELLGLPDAPAKNAGEALRELVWDVVESLRPDISLPPDRPEWLHYHLLVLRYLESRSWQAVCDELGISRRSFFRYQGESLEAVTRILWERYQRTKLSESNPETFSPVRKAREEATRLAREAQRQWVNLQDSLESAGQMVGPLASQQRVTLQMSVPPSLPAVYGDPAMIHQVFLHILTEGIKVTSGDKLELTGEIMHGEVVWQLGPLDEARAPHRDIWRVGGFVIAQGLLDVYGGRLWFERDSVVTVGFAIPFSKTRTILIVDDDAQTIDLYRRYLEAGSYLVQSASSAEQLDKHLAECPPDIILLDVLMPRQDGWKILQRLKAMPETANIPVVICSVLVQPDLALLLGAARVLQKPVEAGTLLKTVRELLPPEGNLG